MEVVLLHLGMQVLKQVFPILFILLFSACAVEEDCVGCNLNPKVEISFEAINTYLLSDNLFTLVKQQIVDISDSLSGNLSDEQKEVLIDKLELLRADSTDFAIVRSGRVRIDALQSPGAENLSQLQDTIISEFSVPIDMRHDTSTFYLAYHGYEDTLQIFYQREITRNLEGVRMKLNGIGVSEEVSTFDSLRVKCNSSECSNDRTTIYIYF
jgi:hypothetical protein